MKPLEIDRSPSIVRFGIYELDLRAGELRKSGVKIKLQEQPFQVLAMLLQHPREVVTREELQKTVWPADTFVDFDRGLNKAINKIREALGDEADNPRFVETLPRRGYRFIAPVDVGAGLVPALASTDAVPVSAGHPQEPAVNAVKGVPLPPTLDGVGAVREPPRRGRGLRGAAMLAMLVVGLAVGWLVWHRSRSLPELTQRPLTSNSEELPVLSGAISPDGKLVAYSDSSGLHIKLPEADEHRTLPWPPGTPSGATWNVAGWFPDGTRLLTNLVQPDGRSSIWTVSVVGQSTRHLRDDAMAWAVSPDGSHIAFAPAPRTHPFLDSHRGATLYMNPVTPENEVWTVATQGGDLQRVLAAGDNESFGTIQWSPGGGRIAYSKTHQALDGVEVTLGTSDLKGGQPTLAVSEPLLTTTFSWLPGGRLIYSQLDPTSYAPDTYNLWEVNVDTRTGQSFAKPVKLTRWVGSQVQGLSSTADGKRLAFLKRSGQSQIRAYVGELEADGTRLRSVRRLTFSNARDFPWTFTADGKAVIVTSDRSGELQLFKQSLDDETAQPVVTGSGEAMVAWLSPDGSWILYAVLPPSFPVFFTTPLMRVPVNGGPAQQVLEARNLADFKCAQSPATLCVVDEMSQDMKSLSVTAFDPVKGRGRMLMRIPRDLVSATPSPDGLRVASLKVGEAEGHIRLLALDGQVEREIRVKGWPGFSTLAWAPDAKAMYCGTASGQGATLLRVDLDGNAQVLWQQKGAIYIGGEPSRDGRHLAIFTAMMDSNLWMLENF